jgi:hypothetical protein
MSSNQTKTLSAVDILAERLVGKTIILYDNFINDVFCSRTLCKQNHRPKCNSIPVESTILRVIEANQSSRNENGCDFQIEVSDTSYDEGIYEFYYFTKITFKDNCVH